MSNRFHVLPLSAHDVAQGLGAVAEEVLGDVHVDLSITSAMPSVSVQVKTGGNAIRREPALIQFTKDVASVPELPCSAAHLRAEGNRQVILLYRIENTQSYFQVDSVSDRPTALNLMASLRKHFKLMSRAAVLGASLPAEDQEAIHFKEQIVGDLAAQVSRLGTFLTQMAERNADLVRSLTLDLEKQFQQKRTELDAQIHAQQEQVDADRSEFEKQRKEFDDRQRTHVRRDLLTKIQKNIDDRAKAAPITTGASNSRRLLHVVSWLVILLSLCGGLYAAKFLYASIGHTPFDWRVVPPFSTAIVLFAATLVFYFRWTARWADRLSHNDLAIQQYASDILRASWIAELLFEYNDEKQKEIPGEVLASLSEGLFKREGFQTVRYHPSDDLAGMLRRLQSFKAGPQGVEITADGMK